MSPAAAVKSVALSIDDDASPRYALQAAVAAACARIAPLWPLESFVAVNPFHGFADQPFGAACATLRRVAGAELLPSLDFYRMRLESGAIADVDLEAALADAGQPRDALSLRQRLAAASAAPRPPPRVATVADVLDRLADGDRETSRTAFMIDEISKWCAAYFDEGEASWRFPWRDEPLYAAWRAAARIDLNPEVMGVTGFRRTIDALPADALATIETIVRALDLPRSAWVDYFHRALLDVHGWAAYARQRAWTSGLRGGQDHTLVDLLALRLAWGYALFAQRTDEAFRLAWRAAIARAERGADPDAADSALAALLQNALEHAERRKLLAALAAPANRRAAPHDSTRREAHAVFCIDVRSEVYRRALEAIAPDMTTSGFAGFFGFALDYVPLGSAHALTHCPVLLAPGITVCESVADPRASDEGVMLARRRRRASLAELWSAFARSAVSSFTFVETFGLAYASKLLRNSFGNACGAPSAAPAAEGAARTGPYRLETEHQSGADVERRAALAEGALRGMGMTRDFARLVLLVGHGSTTTNNPHAAALNCGACGGRTGEANARFAAAVLNAGDVRARLASRGIEIPIDTWFVAALHDTTTDDIRLFDGDPAPPALRADLTKVHERLAAASSRARAERARRLDGARGPDVDAKVLARSRDWSQVRPEWGLARNSGFIAAPRAATRGVSLDGRCFLHEYDWRSDDGFAVLELILTAPLVVATWINLQYYASTVDNRLFGSGNKTLHNVVGRIGVLEGNAGTLRVGLPQQSLSDAGGLVHEPVRLTAVVAAPEAAIDAVLAKHSHVGDLVRNEWLHLVRMTDDGTAFRRRRSAGWEDIALPSLDASTRAA